MVDGVRDAEEWNSRRPKGLFVPKLDACSVAYFDFCVHALEEDFGSTNERIFGLPGRNFIEVDEVVVTNSSLRIFAFEHVPNCLG